MHLRDSLHLQGLGVASGCLFGGAPVRCGALGCLRIAGRYAPLKERMQQLKKPQSVEVLLRLLVQSRSLSGTVRGAKAEGSEAQLEETTLQDVQQTKTVSFSRAPFPLQLLAASASLGRPLHRYLANLTRWKQQQLLLLQAREPPLEMSFLQRDSNGLHSVSTRRQSPCGAFATPQQRMRAAFERLADRGLLGLPRLLSAPAPPPEGAHLSLGVASSPNGFKAVLPIIRWDRVSPSFTLSFKRQCRQHYVS